MRHFNYKTSEWRNSVGKSKETKKRLVLLKESSLLEIQNLLEEEAKNGWFFIEKKACFYYFEKGKSKSLKFRLLPNDDKPSAKELERYKQDGWDYVNNLSRTAIFCGKPSANEIKLQPKKTADIVSKLKSEINFQIGFIFAITVIAIISWIAVTFSHGYFWKNMMDNWNSNFSIPLVYVVLIIISAMLLIDKMDYHKAFKNLPAVGKGNAKRKKVLLCTRTIITSILSIIAVVVFILTMSSMFSGINGRDIMKYKGKNMVALMDVEEIDEFYTKKQYENLGVVQNVNTTPVYEGSYSIGSTLLCKEHLQWQESLTNKNEKYSASLNGEYYNIKTEKLAKKLYKELVDKIDKDIKEQKKYADEVPKRKYKKFAYDEMKLIYVDNRYVVLVREKNEIYNIRFNGKNDVTNVMEYIATAFAKEELGI